jgi:hypothetical protein
MSESTSRILAGLEGVFLCLPITALFLYGGAPSVIYFLFQTPGGDAIVLALACLFVVVALVCAWRLLLAFVCGGRTSLRAVTSGWWKMAYLTAGFSILAPFWVAFAEKPLPFGMFGWGLPFLLPLVHLHFERK